jgi:hypothetical protein
MSEKSFLFRFINSCSGKDTHINIHSVSYIEKDSDGTGYVCIAGNSTAFGLTEDSYDDLLQCLNTNNSLWDTL